MRTIIGYRKVYYAVSSVLVIASIVALALWQLRFGIDFAGGALWELALPREANVATEEIVGMLQPLGIENIIASRSDDGEVLTLRFLEVTPATYQAAWTALGERFPGIEELRFELVGPTISETMRQNALRAIAAVMIIIVLYVTWAFRQVSRAVASWKYGAITLATLFHDVLIPIGLFSVLGHFAGIEVDSQFVAAMLVIMAFSVHDTIVVFDRVRENIHNAEPSEKFETIVERSLRQTIIRSLNTSLTLMVVLAALWVWGPDSLRWFSMVLLVGTALGTYSSIFLASPLLVDMEKRRGAKIGS